MVDLLPGHVPFRTYFRRFHLTEFKGVDCNCGEGNNTKIHTVSKCVLPRKSETKRFIETNHKVNDFKTNRHSIIDLDTNDLG